MKRISDAVRKAIEDGSDMWAYHLGLEFFSLETKDLVNDASVMALAERLSGSFRREFQAGVKQ